MLNWFDRVSPGHSSCPRKRESSGSARLDSRLRGHDVREVSAVCISSPRRRIGLSSARHRVAALSSDRLFFGNFLLAKQKKVTALSGAQPDARPPGRNPAKPSSSAQQLC